MEVESKKEQGIRENAEGSVCRTTPHGRCIADGVMRENFLSAKGLFKIWPITKEISSSCHGPKLLGEFHVKR